MDPRPSHMPPCVKHLLRDGSLREGPAFHGLHPHRLRLSPVLSVHITLCLALWVCAFWLLSVLPFVRCAKGDVDGGGGGWRSEGRKGDPECSHSFSQQTARANSTPPGHRSRCEAAVQAPGFDAAPNDPSRSLARTVFSES